jgi:hypothetical protein
VVLGVLLAQHRDQPAVVGALGQPVVLVLQPVRVLRRHHLLHERLPAGGGEDGDGVRAALEEADQADVAVHLEPVQHLAEVLALEVGVQEVRHRAGDVLVPAELVDVPVGRAQLGTGERGAGAPGPVHEQGDDGDDQDGDGDHRPRGRGEQEHRGAVQAAPVAEEAGHALGVRAGGAVAESRAADGRRGRGRRGPVPPAQRREDGEGDQQGRAGVADPRGEREAHVPDQLAALPEEALEPEDDRPQLEPGAVLQLGVEQGGAPPGQAHQQRVLAHQQRERGDRGGGDQQRGQGHRERPAERDVGERRHDEQGAGDQDDVQQPLEDHGQEGVEEADPQRPGDEEGADDLAEPQRPHEAEQIADRQVPELAGQAAAADVVDRDLGAGRAQHVPAQLDDAGDAEDRPVAAGESVDEAGAAPRERGPREGHEHGQGREGEPDEDQTAPGVAMEHQKCGTSSTASPAASAASRPVAESSKASPSAASTPSSERALR